MKVCIVGASGGAGEACFGFELGLNSCLGLYFEAE